MNIIFASAGPSPGTALMVPWYSLQHVQTFTWAAIWASSSAALTSHLFQRSSNRVHYTILMAVMAGSQVTCGSFFARGAKNEPQREDAASLCQGQVQALSRP